MSDAPTAPADSPERVAFDPAEAIRQARAFLAMQAEIAGTIRYLGPDTASAPSDSPRLGASADAADTPVQTPHGGSLSPSPSVAPALTEADAPAAPTPSDDTVPDLFGALPDPSQDLTLSPYQRIESLIPEEHPLRAMTSLEEIHAWLSETVLVPIDENRINPVLGTGPADADLMIIGEAPGADEDKTGEPFVGRAGQLLNKILDAILFDRDEVYIANILKSRPPNNRDPLAAEVEAHIPILYKQIALIQPKVILAVGKSAGNGLLGRTSSLASLRGTFHDYYGIPLMVTYHPAALLRNPQWKRPTWEDVKLLRTRYDEIGGCSRRSA
ncbi:MAG: uracil-DNA glycosylase family protein [Bacteroidota bacterium]